MKKSIANGNLILAYALVIFVFAAMALKIFDCDERAQRLFDTVPKCEDWGFETGKVSVIDPNSKLLKVQCL